MINNKFSYPKNIYIGDCAMMNISKKYIVFDAFLGIKRRFLHQRAEPKIRVFFGE